MTQSHWLYNSLYPILTKMHKANSLNTFILLFISLLPFVVIVNGDYILTVLEYDETELDFPYPCNCSRVTLQYGNRAPSFNSANPGSTSLPSNQHLRNISASKNNECSLHLTINPVSRNDAGTYILTGYNQDDQYIYDVRVGLRVSYPPGVASCDSDDAYIEGEWIRLHCSAPVGNLAGQIVCYQSGRRLPPLTPPEERGSKLNQIILARLDDIVYCCSSTLQQIKDTCECKDSAWDPFRSQVANATKPCPIVQFSTLVQSSTSIPTEAVTEDINTTFTAVTATQEDMKIDVVLNYVKALEGISTVMMIFIGLRLVACMLDSVNLGLSGCV